MSRLVQQGCQSNSKNLSFVEPAALTVPHAKAHMMSALVVHKARFFKIPLVSQTATLVIPLLLISQPPAKLAQVTASTVSEKLESVLSAKTLYCCLKAFATMLALKKYQF